MISTVCKRKSLTIPETKKAAICRDEHLNRIGEVLFNLPPRSDAALHMRCLRVELRVKQWFPTSLVDVVPILNGEGIGNGKNFH